MEEATLNYRDLRVQKTEKAIRKAFHELAQEKSIQKITVRELVQRAEINKTTFYAHYDTIQDLIDTLESEAITYIINHLGNLSTLLDDPDTFIEDLYQTLSNCKIHNIAQVNPNRKEFAEKLNLALRDEEKRFGAKEWQKLRILVFFIINGFLGFLHTPFSTNETDLNAIKEFVKQGLTTLSLHA